MNLAKLGRQAGKQDNGFLSEKSKVMAGVESTKLTLAFTSVFTLFHDLSPVSSNPGLAGSE